MIVAPETVHKWAKWCRGHGPDPGRRAIEAMFAAMQRHMDPGLFGEGGAVPVHVNEARSFRAGADFLCVVSVVFAPGRADAPFARWWAWRHVQFEWSRQAMPAMPAFEREPA